MSQFWKKLKWFTKGQTAHSYDNHIYNEQHFNSFHCEIAPDWVNQEIQYFSHSTHNELEQDISSMEITSIILKHKRKSAPGPDQITYEMIQHMPLNYFEDLAAIFTYFLQNNIIPDSWHDFHVLPIIKTNKNQNSPTSYRPIALSNTLRKIFEKIIVNRLLHYLEKNKLWPQMQYGFRPGYSTMNNLSIFNIDILLAFHKKEIIEATFLDISKAFDSVRINLLQQDLLEYKIPHSIINIITSLMINRRIYMKTHAAISNYRLTSLGLPQGSSLSPILFNLYTGKLFEQIHSHARLLQYADDIILYISCNKLQLQHAYNAPLQLALNKAAIWLENKGLQLNVNKCKHIYFSRINKFQVLNLKLLNIIIPITDNVKFLGLHMDSKMNWKLHYDNLAHKTREAKKILKYLSGRWWGSNQNTLIHIYKTFIRQKLEYGLFLTDYTYKKYLKPLNKEIYDVCKTISGINGNPDHLALIHELGLQEPHTRAEILATNFLTKCVSTIDNPILPKLQLLCKIYKPQYINRSNQDPSLIKIYKSLQNFKIIQLPHTVQQYTTWQMYWHNFSVIMDFCEITSLRLYWNNIPPQLLINTHSTIHIYTDGSKNDKGTGAAIYCPTNNYSKKYKLSPYTSIYTAEAFAVRQAILYVSQYKYSNVTIFSDSLSVLQSIKHFGYTIQKNWYIKNIKELLFKYSYLNINLAWIPAHKNIHGNETADLLAKSAIETGSPTNILLPAIDVKTYIKQHIHDNIQEKWNKYIQHKAIRYGNLSPKINLKPWFNNFSTNRSLITTIIRLRMGTAQTPCYLYKINASNSPNCVCGEVGSINHMLLACHNKTLEIDRFYKTLSDLKVHFPTKIELLISNPKPHIIKELFQHISRCKMKI